MMAFKNAKSRRAFFARKAIEAKLKLHNIRVKHEQKQRIKYENEKAKLQKDIQLEQLRLQRRAIRTRQKEQLEQLKNAHKKLRLARYKSSSTGKAITATSHAAINAGRWTGNKIANYEKKHGKQQLKGLKKLGKALGF